jgi:hypothetical protein
MTLTIVPAWVPNWHWMLPYRLGKRSSRRSGRVYLNPPYGREIDNWVARLVDEHASGSVPEAVALVPARVDTEWFRRLDPFPRCFIWGRQQHLELDREGTAGLVGCVQQVGKWGRVLIRARGLCGAEGRQSLRRHDPWRDRGVEALRQERPERLVFPGLHVPRRPVVEQAVAGDVLGRLTDWDRRAVRVAGADPHPPSSSSWSRLRHGPKLGSASSGRLRWPFGRRTGTPEGRTVEARPW